jgi:hypothetical protein
MKSPSPWATVIIGVAALVISTISATFTGFNYFRSSDPPGIVLISKQERNSIEEYFNKADDYYRTVRELPRDTSKADFDRFREEIYKWANPVGSNIMNNLSATEYRRLIDPAGRPPDVPDPNFSDPNIRQEQADLVFLLGVMRSNLLRLFDRAKVK